jgi:hypothetical protein
MLSSMPRRSDPRPRLRYLQNPPHSRRRQPPVRKLAAGDAQETLGELLSSLILIVRPIKIQKPRSLHLNEEVSVDLERSIHLRSNVPQRRSDRNGTSQSDHAKCQPLV